MKGLVGALAVLVFAVVVPLLLLLRRGLEVVELDVIGADIVVLLVLVDGHISLEGGGAPLSGS